MLIRRGVKNIMNLSKEELKQLSFYEILGVPESVNRVKIRKSYLRLVKGYHPDLRGTPSVLSI